jgi:hypothetical protein
MKIQKLLIIACVAGGAYACNGDIKDYCAAQAECEGGNDADEDACVEQISASEEVAASYDCSDQWQKAADCNFENASCQTDPSDNEKYFSSRPPGGDDPCTDEEDAFDACVAAASKLDDQ